VAGSPARPISKLKAPTPHGGEALDRAEKEGKVAEIVCHRRRSLIPADGAETSSPARHGPCPSSKASPKGLRGPGLTQHVKRSADQGAFSMRWQEFRRHRQFLSQSQFALRELKAFRVARQHAECGGRAAQTRRQGPDHEHRSQISIRSLRTEGKTSSSSTLSSECRHGGERRQRLRKETQGTLGQGRRRSRRDIDPAEGSTALAKHQKASENANQLPRHRQGYG